MNSDVKKALIDGERLGKLIRHVFLTLAPLDADCNLAGQHWRRDKQSQFWSRFVIRCLCANIEARLYVYRSTALEMVALSKVNFAQDELDMLREERVDKNGVKKAKWLHIRDSVKESMRLFAKAVGTPFHPDCSGKGYAAFC